MKIADLKPGQEVAVKNGYGSARRAVVVATEGYYLRSRSSWSQKKAVHSPGRKGEVAIATEYGGYNDDPRVWGPEVVMPNQIVRTWEDELVRQEQARQNQITRKMQNEIVAKRLNKIREEIALLQEELDIKKYVSHWTTTVELTITEYRDLLQAVAEGETK